MHTMLKKAICVAVGSLALAAGASADDAVIGEGRAPLGAGTASAIRGAAKQDAVRDAVLKAIKDATALDASDDRFAPIVAEVAKQMRDIRVTSEESVGAEFVTRVAVNVDRKQIKNAIRGTDLDKLNDRSFGILMLVDEFVTSTRDLNLPLEELVEMKYDAGSSFRDKSIKAASSSASANSAVGYSASVNASQASSSKVDAKAQSAIGARSGDESFAAGAKGSLQASNANASSLAAKASYAAAANSKSASASVDAKNVAAASHETASYKKLVKYQDASKPTSHPLFLNEFAGKLRDYDLRLIDSMNARSKYFGDKPINLALLSNSAEMARFSEFARTKANADFLMVGSATVVSGERNPATGELSCVVNAEVKTFATAGGELISSMSESTQSSGANIEACNATATQKVARMMAPAFAGSTLGYWADRAARGRQYTVEFKGANLALPLRMAFSKALQQIDGAAAVEKKSDGPDGVMLTLTLKGKGDPMEQIYAAVTSQPAFAGKDLDGKSEGEQVTLCLNKCGAPEPKTKKR
jgi:hypothetical protein